MAGYQDQLFKAMSSKIDKAPIGKYKFNGAKLRGRRKDKVYKKWTESRVRRKNNINPNQSFD